MVAWGTILAAYLFAAQAVLPIDLRRHHRRAPLAVRIVVALAVLMPAGFLMGFAFPTGMTLIEAVSREPAPWFWGINGATGVLASVLAVISGIAFGINVTMIARRRLLPAADSRSARIESSRHRLTGGTSAPTIFLRRSPRLPGSSDAAIGSRKYRQQCRLNQSALSARASTT